jgi:hypothetical protein
MLETARQYPGIAFDRVISGGGREFFQTPRRDPPRHTFAKSRLRRPAHPFDGMTRDQSLFRAILPGSALAGNRRVTRRCPRRSRGPCARTAAPARLSLMGQGAVA